jgi:hypothetical protein|tara:strand:+ start:129 stop:545 length:417 start_codon:yes stop_codon:yes gene_type:complete
MSKVVIGTQYKENYNTTGEGEPYWKFKGGSEFIVSIPKGMSAWNCYIEVAPLIEYKNEMSEEFILDHFVAEDNYQSDFEKSQLEYEGVGGYKEPRLEKVDGVWKYTKRFENSDGAYIDTWTIAEGNETTDWVHTEELH